jgi:hypothetical protein
MGGIPGKALQSAHNHGFDARIVNRARRSRPRLIVQPVHAALDKTPAPFAHSCPVQAQSGRHFYVLAAFGAGQHYPGPECERLRRLATRRQRLQLCPLVIAEPQGRKFPDRHQILRRCCQHIPGTATRIYCESNVANL